MKAISSARPARRPLCVSVLTLLGGVLYVSSAHAQFASGNLVIERMGDGSAALGSGSTPVFVDQFTTTGSSVNTINLPNAASRPSSAPFNLTDSGSATSEGLLSRSANGLTINLFGYNGINGDASIANSSTTTILRTAGIISGNGTVTTSKAFTVDSGNNARAIATADGSTLYGIGGGGIDYLGAASSGSGTSLTTRTTRQGAILNNTLFVTSGSNGTPYTAGNGVYQVGTAGTLPTAAAPTFTQIINTGTTAYAYAFQFNTAMTVAYLTNDTSATGGIEKWTQSGGTWTKVGTISFGTTSAAGARGLTVDWSNPSAPVLYATTADATLNRLVKVVDTGSTFSSLGFTTLATAPTNEAFRGVDLALLPSVWTGSTGGNWASTTTTTYNTTLGAVATPYDNWSTNLVDGTNLAFQKVNASSLTLNNNTGLTKVASIGFSGQGFGTSDTAYTLNGNALILNGTDAIGSGVTGSGITNNSTATQTVNIPLTLGSNQKFTANTGALAIGGSTLNLGSGAVGNTLTVSGAQNTTISSTIQNGGTAAGSLVKTGNGALTLGGSNTYSGPTNVKAGTLIVSGSLSGSSAVTVGDAANLGTTATFGGAGSVGDVTVGAAAGDTGATLNPHAGSASTSAGTTTNVGSVTFLDSSAHLALEIGRTSAGATTASDASDHLHTTSAVNLNGADLQLSLLTTTGYTIAQNDVLFLIVNGGGSAINGTFGSLNGVPTTLTEGSAFTLGSQVYDITYLANFAGNSATGGNDVALIAVPEPSAFASAALGAGLLMTYRRFRRTMRIGTSA